MLNAIRRRLDAMPAETRARIFRASRRLFFAGWLCSVAAFVWYFTGFEHVAVPDDLHALEWNHHGTTSYVRPAHARIFHVLLWGGGWVMTLCGIAAFATWRRGPADSKAP